MDADDGRKMVQVLPTLPRRSQKRKRVAAKVGSRATHELEQLRQANGASKRAESRTPGMAMGGNYANVGVQAAGLRAGIDTGQEEEQARTEPSQTAIHRRS